MKHTSVGIMYRIQTTNTIITVAVAVALLFIVFIFETDTRYETRHDAHWPSWHFHVVKFHIAKAHYLYRSVSFQSLFLFSHSLSLSLTLCVCVRVVTSCVIDFSTPDAVVHFDAVYTHILHHSSQLCLYVDKTEMDRLSVYNKVIHQTKLRLWYSARSLTH